MERVFFSVCAVSILRYSPFFSFALRRNCFLMQQRGWGRGFSGFFSSLLGFSFSQKGVVSASDLQYRCTIARFRFTSFFFQVGAFLFFFSS